MPNSAAKREDALYLAKLAEQAERYDEMADYMRDVVVADPNLSVESRNLLSVAFKNSVGSRRASWRIVSSVEQKEMGRNSTENAALAATYRQIVEKELKDICAKILRLLDDHLIPAADSQTGEDPIIRAEGQVFYYKMKGDYHRYVAEFAAGGDKTTAASQADQAYSQATLIAEADLSVTHPVRLGLALNYSVFTYEVKNECDTACNMARNAFEEAIADLDNVSEETYKDSTLIMQLLRDNLTLWSPDTGAENNDN